MEYRRDGHRVHLVVYHLIWCPKRRKAVLGGKVARRLQQIVEEVCAENGWEILKLAISPDHVHLFLRATPTVAIQRIMNAIKGRSSRLLRQEFLWLKRLPSLWTRSYFASTAGNVSAETIQRCIEAQSRT